VDLLIAVAGNLREDWEVQVKAIQLRGSEESQAWICFSTSSIVTEALGMSGDQIVYC
jgi:hypothetical protein